MEALIVGCCSYFDDGFKAESSVCIESTKLLAALPSPLDISETTPGTERSPTVTVCAL